MPKPPPDSPRHCEARSAEAIQASRHETRVLLGVIGRAHGVRGLLHVTSYTNPPEALPSYGPLQDNEGRRFTLCWRGEGIAEFTDQAGTKISDRTTADRLVNTRLYVERAQFPTPDPDEFYITDLVGLTAVTPEGQPLGRVETVHDYGAGASLETDNGLLVPFNRASVPAVDLASGRVTISPPEPLDITPP